MDIKIKNRMALTLLAVVCFCTTMNAQKNIPDYGYQLYQGGKGTTVKASGTPEFAFLMPEMAGNFKTGIIAGDKSVWLKNAGVSAKTSRGRITYSIISPLLQKGKLQVTVCSLEHTDGMIMQVEASDIPGNIDFFWSYGGASGKPVTGLPDLDPSSCRYNVFSVEGNAFTLYYGQSMALRVIHGVVPPASEIRLSDAYRQSDPLSFFNSGKKTDAPALAAKFPLVSGKYFFCFYKQNAKADYNYFMLPGLFNETEAWLANQSKKPKE